MKFSSLAAPKVVILTTFGAASDEDFIKMKTFSFQCGAFYWILYVGFRGPFKDILPMDWWINTSPLAAQKWKMLFPIYVATENSICSKLFIGQPTGTTLRRMIEEVLLPNLTKSNQIKSIAISYRKKFTWISRYIHYTGNILNNINI